MKLKKRIRKEVKKMADNINKDKECKKGECITVRPVADVTDEHDGVEISFEIPGAKAEDISLEVKDRLLTLRAASSLHRRGLPVSYNRAFYLSDAVDTGNISAKVSDGVLTLFLPKAASAKSHRIEVK
jgi:HSP20 family protein